MMKLTGVAKTALLVAALRAQETERSEIEGRLFSDPFARDLASQEGFELLAEGIKVSGEQPAIAFRTCYMDAQVMEAKNNGVEQFVILAAGMDSRAYRLDFTKKIQVFEVDQKDVIDYKKLKLKQFDPKANLHSIKMDLRDNWEEELIQNGFDLTKKTLWMTEGLLMYLDEASVDSLFTRISKMSKPCDILLFDLLGRSLLDAPFMKVQLDFIAKTGAPWLFGNDNPEEFMKKFGWTAYATIPAEVAPHRWPFPIVPRHIPNVPRSFFVKAVKD